MSKQEHVEASEVLLLSRIAHVVERAGLSLAGAMCGTFVAAQLTRTDPARFDTVGFIVAMVLTGMIGFYLGIDIPRLRVPPASAATAQPKVDPVELLSATGTFLATIAALISVYAFVFDAAPQRSFEYMVASWWMIGVAMQIGAGVMARMWLASKAL
ncbi:MAG TPA: hypothetical protein VNS33_13505 [Bradyrhizobium sp.]|nr:hypothetical protein [Bradyrhizobium sp.]